MATAIEAPPGIVDRLAMLRLTSRSESPVEDGTVASQPAESLGSELASYSIEHQNWKRNVIFRLEPMFVLELLCTSIGYLLERSISVPPTPPPSTPITPNMKSLQSEKDELNSKLEAHQRRIRRRGMSEKGCSPSTLGVEAASAATQHGVVVRKFYSKHPPPVPLKGYLHRLQTYCHMSTAVCLAASHYIFQLALVERVLQLSELNVHRLALAALRVSSKLLEDRTWAQSRFCKVGGVTETEMKHLETSFCFAMNFELKVDERILEQEYIALREIAAKAGQISITSGPPSAQVIGESSNGRIMGVESVAETYGRG